MMLRNFSKAGLWLFIAAVVWYLSANTLLDNIKKEKIAHAQSVHLSSQQANIGSNDKVVIRASGEDFRMRNVSLVFDPGITQALIHNENLELAATPRLLDGVLNIGLTQVDINVDHRSSTKTEIRLPSSVNRVEIVGPGYLNISGNFPAPAANLILEVSACESNLKIQELAVGRLNYVSSCERAKIEECCSPELELGEKNKIEKLEVTMPHGRLNISGNAIPQTTVLNVGDDVSITGRSAFMQSARFSPSVLKN